MDDIADRDEEGSGQGEQCGEIRFRHQPPPAVPGPSLETGHPKAWAQRAATCLNVIQNQHGGAAVRGRCADPRAEGMR